MDNKQYNLYNFEAEFKQYLIAGNEGTQKDAKTGTLHENTQEKIQKKTLANVSVKNYLSDFRHFSGWVTFYLKSQKNNNVRTDVGTGLGLSLRINADLITNYKSYLVENNLPIKTINRRLSTLRKFCTFCISQGWMKENPGKQIQNAKVKSQKYNIEFKTKSILKQFEEYLLNNGYGASEKDNQLNNIKEFIELSDFTFNF